MTEGHLTRGIAQLVARMHGVHEAVGSSPATPTKKVKPDYINGV